jgi:hypothetical protein
MERFRHLEGSVEDSTVERREAHATVARWLKDFLIQTKEHIIEAERATREPPEGNGADTEGSDWMEPDSGAIDPDA